MNATLSLFAVPLLTFQLVVVSSLNDKKCQGPDVSIVEIEQPEWIHAERTTLIKVTIKNEGDKMSEPFILTLEDLDISAKEVSKGDHKKSTVELVEENNARAEYYSKSEYVEEGDYDIDENTYDYDKDWVITKDIYELMPDEELTVSFYLKDHWVYDSNCEIRASVDKDMVIEDCDRSNNILDFFGWG